MSNGGEFGPQIRQVKLEKQSELRIQVKSLLKLRLLYGKAEIFGFELPLEIWLTFTPLTKPALKWPSGLLSFCQNSSSRYVAGSVKISFVQSVNTFQVFTWYGAMIEIDGITEDEYTSCETPMKSYLNVHNSLQIQRQRVTYATRDSVTSSQGPRVIIVGNIDSGKSTLAKMLLNWAVKDGWKPTFVDLNVGQSSITIPGTIAATPIEMHIDPIEGFPLDKAIVHYFGHPTPTVNRRLYKSLVEDLAQDLNEEFARNVESRASGMVIDTMGWINHAGFELLVHAIRTFNASVVIVLGQEEKLVNDLKSALKFKKNLQVLNLEKSVGVISRDSKFRQTLRNKNIQNYFYGVTNDLTVYTKTVKFSDVQVYRFGDFPGSSSTSAQKRGNNPLKITLVEIDDLRVNKVLAISYAKQPHQIISSMVAGFVCITNVDIGEEKITYVSPSAAELPSKILIMGTLTWHVT